MSDIENEMGNVENAVQKVRRLIEEHRAKFVMLPSQSRCQVFDKRTGTIHKEGKLVSCYDAKTNTLTQVPDNWDWDTHKNLKRPDFRKGSLGLILLGQWKMMIAKKKADFYTRRADWFQQEIKLYRLLEIHLNYDKKKDEDNVGVPPILSGDDTNAALLKLRKRIEAGEDVKL